MVFSRKVSLCALILIGALAFGLALFTVSANADEKEKKQSSEKETTSGAGLSAMKAGKSEDGSLRQTTKAEDNILAAEIRKTLAKYTKQSLKSHPNGAKSVVTVPFSLAFSVATIDKDGKVHYDCEDANGIAKTNQDAAEEK